MTTTKKTFLIPGIVSIIFIASCFTPVIQILIMTLDGGLQYVVNSILFSDDVSKFAVTNWITNFSLSILFLFLYIKSKKALTQIIFSVISILFLFSLIAFITGNGYGDPDPYYLYFLTASVVSSLILFVTAILKYQLFTRQKPIIER